MYKHDLMPVNVMAVKLVTDLMPQDGGEHPSGLLADGRQIQVQVTFL